MRKRIIGVMGPGKDAAEIDINNAFNLGELIAKEGWIVLNGGRNSGVMHAVSKGAQKVGGTVIGMLPDDNLEFASDGVDIAITTGIGGARNYINALSGDVMVACGMNAGTASEVSFALNKNRKVVLLNTGKYSEEFFKSINPELVYICSSPDNVIKQLKELIV